jgi:hypothetical protein
MKCGTGGSMRITALFRKNGLKSNTLQQRQELQKMKNQPLGINPTGL